MKAEKFVRKYLSEAPLSFIYKLFRLKDVKVNGHWVKKDHVLKAGDVVRLYVSDSQLEDFNKPKPLSAKELPYPVAYEDENILIIDKPAGLLVYGDINEKRKTLTQAVREYLLYKGEYHEGDAFSPSPAHRLDRNTAGLVVYAKNNKALSVLEDAFKERKGIKKEYLALVKGKIKEKGRVEAPLKKDPKMGLVKVTPIKDGGAYALTEYEPVKEINGNTLVSITLHTGRTHQIRVHMAYIGHPVVGDPKYGDFALNKEVRDRYGLSSQWLVAYRLHFGKLASPLENLEGKSIGIDIPSQFKALV